MNWVATEEKCLLPACTGWCCLSIWPWWPTVTFSFVTLNVTLTFDTHHIRCHYSAESRTSHTPKLSPFSHNVTTLQKLKSQAGGRNRAECQWPPISNFALLVLLSNLLWRPPACITFGNICTGDSILRTSISFSGSWWMADPRLYCNRNMMAWMH